MSPERWALIKCWCKTLNMPKSEEVSRAFYAQLGAVGLAKRTRPEWDEKIIRALVEMLPRNASVLDLGCGYGRIALPLARAGYHVEGLDLSQNLIEAARATAGADGLRLGFVVGSMTSLPYTSTTFDAVICLWSAFNELLEEDDQARAISEMWRVLRSRGFALIEGPVYKDPSDAELDSRTRRGAGKSGRLGSRRGHRKTTLRTRRAQLPPHLRGRRCPAVRGLRA
jgi:SAM-dependent methyltransferase